jgi:hypothetical protein
MIRLYVICGWSSTNTSVSLCHFRVTLRIEHVHEEYSHTLETKITYQTATVIKVSHVGGWQIYIRNSLLYLFFLRTHWAKSSFLMNIAIQWIPKEKPHTYRYEGVICYPLLDSSNNLVSSSLKKHAWTCTNPAVLAFASGAINNRWFCHVRLG